MNDSKPNQAWKEHALEDVIEKFIDYRGKTPNKTISGIPLITAKIVKDGRILPITEYIAEKDYVSWMKRGFPESGDVILTTEAPLGEIAQVSDDHIALAQRIITLRANKDFLLNDYLKYSLQSPLMQHRLRARQSGSTVTGIKASELRKVMIPLPPLPEQRAIAAVLSSFDDKIELLRSQNQTLEKIAQTLFKEWFIDFNFPNEDGKPYKKSGGKMVESEMGVIPEGWRVGKLSEEFEIIMGQSPPGTSYNCTGNGMIFFQGRAEFTERFPKTRLYTTEPKKIADKFDTLVSVRAPVGDINVASEKCCIGRGLAAVKSDYRSYAFYKITSLKDVFNKFEAEGTVFGSINKDSFKNIKNLIPIDNYVRKYNITASAIDEKLYNNFVQMRSISNMRDFLLPYLMQGKLNLLRT
jgi:type I restriction enzyme, S subunit